MVGLNNEILDQGHDHELEIQMPSNILIRMSGQIQLGKIMLALLGDCSF